MTVTTAQPNARAHILETAWRLIGERGVHAVTVADIAAASGVSRQLVYHHFDSRAGLLVAMARHHDGASGFRRRFAASRELPPVEGLETLLELWLQYVPLILPVARALEAAVITGDEGEAAWRDRMDDIHETFRLAVERIEGEGRLADGLDGRHGGGLGLCAQPRRDLAAPCRRSRVARAALRRAHDRLDHGRGRGAGRRRMTIRPGSIPASALSPRRRGCPLDPGPIVCPAETGSGSPREQWPSLRAFVAGGDGGLVGPRSRSAHGHALQGTRPSGPLPPTRGRKRFRPAVEPVSRMGYVQGGG